MGDSPDQYSALPGSLILVPGLWVWLGISIERSSLYNDNSVMSWTTGKIYKVASHQEDNASPVIVLSPQWCHKWAFAIKNDTYFFRSIKTTLSLWMNMTSIGQLNSAWNLNHFRDNNFSYYKKFLVWHTKVGRLIIRRRSLLLVVQ